MQSLLEDFDVVSHDMMMWQPIGRISSEPWEEFFISILL